MRSILLFASIASAWAAIAFAEEPAREPAPLALTIRPSSVEETPAERLARRAERLDFALRFICRGCSAARSPAPDTPFDPASVLGQGRR